jgi:hypothetical protein
MSEARVSDERELGRRKFVVAATVAAAGAATATAAAQAGRLAGAPFPAEPSPRRIAPDPEVARFLGDVRAGARIDRWTVEAVHPVRMGAVPIVLRTATGARFQVDLLRRDDATRGVAQTEMLSLFLANRGDGSTATDEEQGLGAMALAEAIGRSEARGARMPALLTMRERREQHPIGGYSVLSLPA